MLHKRKCNCRQAFLFGDRSYWFCCPLAWMNYTRFSRYQLKFLLVIVDTFCWSRLWSPVLKLDKWLRSVTPRRPMWNTLPYEPRHEKTCFCHMRTTKAQIAFLVHCLDSIISLVSISEISSLYLDSLAAQAGLRLPWPKTLKTGFLVTWFI